MPPPIADGVEKAMLKQLLFGEGGDPRGKEEAARRLFTVLRCFPDSELPDVARTTIYRAGLSVPDGPLACPKAPRP